MNIQFFNSAQISQQIANVKCGEFWGGTVNEVNNTRILDGTEEIGIVTTTWNFTSFNISPNVEYDFFPLGDPETFTDETAGEMWQNATKRKVYTIGGSYFEIAFYENENNYYIAFSFPRMLNGTGYTSITHFHNGSYFWNIANTNNYPPLQINKDEYILKGIAFFVGNITYSNQTYDMIVPAVMCTLHNSDEIFAYATKRGFTQNAIAGFFDIPTYNPTNNDVQLGGTGNGHYNSDAPEEINVNARNFAFSITSGNGQGLTYYSVNGAEFNNFMSFVYGDHIFGDSEKYINAIVGAHLVPVSMTSSDGNTGRSIFISNDTFRTASNVLMIRNRVKGDTVGYIDLQNSGYDDFNDYANTRATLYLPFVGRVGIDIDTIARGTMRISYLIDVFNGNIAYWVYVKGRDFPNETLYNVYTGNCAVEIPVAGSGRTGDILGKIINRGSQIALGVSSGISGIIPAVNGAIGFASDINKRTINKTGINDTSSTVVQPYRIRLDIEKINIIRPENYKEYNGIPSFSKSRLGDLSGYVEVHSADLSGLSCEEYEKEEIMNILRNGVYV